MVDTINNEVQKTEQSEFVILWELDLTALGGDTHYFIEASLDPTPIVWNSITYTPFDIEADGFEWNGQGTLPTPKIKFSTTNVAVTAYINDFNDLCGGTVTRTRTYRKFMDGQSAANPNEYFSKDIYRINQKTSENKYFAEFELSSTMDQQGILLPRGQLVPYCRAIYRRWDATSGTWIINPSDLACPYAGTNKFTIDDVSTSDPTQDKCNHLVTGCKTRFWENGVLPLMGFPGMEKPTIG